MTTYTALFPLGRTVQTPYAKDELTRLNYSPLNLLIIRKPPALLGRLPKFDNSRNHREPSYL